MSKRFTFILLILLLSALSLFAQSKQKMGRIVGTVLELATQQPIIGANVTVIDTQMGAATDTEGKFSMVNVPVGTYTLRISCIGFKPLFKTDVVVSTGQPVQLHVQLEDATEQMGEVVVTGPYFYTPKELVTSTHGINYEEIRRQPGALEDVSRMIQTMPGVVPTNDQRNDLVVRGGSPSENLTVVDNVEVPNLSHFGTQGASGGPISMLNTEFIREADFSAGGFSAQHGDRLSSVLNIHLREGNRESLAGIFDLGLAGAGFIAEGPFNSRGSWMFSARRSYLDLIIKDFGLAAVPKYSNYQAKAVYNIDRSNKLWLVSLGGIDDIHFTVDQNDKDDPSLLDIKSGGWRTVSGINWQRLWGKGYGTFVISDALSAFEQEVYDKELQNQLVFKNRSTEGETTLKYDIVQQIKSVGEVTAGISGKFMRNRLRINSPLGNENPFSTDTMRVHQFGLDDSFTTSQAAAYTQISITPVPGVDLTLGARWDHFDYIKKNVISPRTGLRYQLMENLSLNTSFGIFYQLPPLVFLRAVPQNQSLEPMRADHYVLGLSYFPRPDVKVTIEVYRKNYSRYPVSLEYPTYSYANDGDQYTINGRLIPLVSEGEGHATGMEFYVQKKLSDHLYGQISYSYSATRHAARDGVLRPGSFDIPLVLSIVGGYRLNEKWEFSSKFTYTSGRPYTPYKFPESRDQNRPIYDLQQVNARRSPAYSRLDLRMDHRSHFDGWNLVTYLELQNLYNRKNVFQYVWNPKTREVQAVNQIAFFVVGGIKIEL